MTRKTYGELALINSAYDVGLQYHAGTIPHSNPGLSSG